jgi:hypothetical protein
MPVIEELIRKETDGGISFGNYHLDQKQKVSDFEVSGDLYKVKTFKEITKLEKNGMILFESVPGTSVHNMKVTEEGMFFAVESTVDPQITVELEPETEYTVYIEEADLGKMKSNLSGKLNLSIEIKEGLETAVKILKA